MLRLLRLLVAFVGLLVIVLFAIGNRTPVEVSFWPTPVMIDLPLYAVFMIGLLIGVVVAALIASIEMLRLRLENRRLARRLHGYEFQMRLRESAEDEAAVQRLRERRQSTALTVPSRG